MDIEIRFRPEYETYINNQLGDYIEYYKGQSSTSLYTNKSERIKNLENLKKNVSYRLQYRTDMNSKLKKNKLVQLPMSMREYDGWVQFVTNGGDIVYKGKSLIFILENDLNKTRIEIPLISTKKSTIISLNKGNKFYEDLVQFDKIKMFLKKLDSKKLELHNKLLSNKAKSKELQSIYQSSQEEKKKLLPKLHEYKMNLSSGT